MINLQYLIFFSFFAAAAIYFWSYMRRLKQDFLVKLLSRSILNKQAEKGTEIFFCEPVVREVARRLGRQKKAQKALSELLSGNPQAAEKYLSGQGDQLNALLLSAHFSSDKIIPKLEKFIKKQPKCRLALCCLAELYFLAGRKEAGQRMLGHIDLKKSSRYICGTYWYWQTGFYLREGDMQSASQACSMAEKYFTRDGDLFSAARASLLMGTIYRVCFVDDVASFMFRGALKIFQQIKYIPGQAVAYGYLGMLNAASEHFDEAEAYFRQAEKLYSLEKVKTGRAEIINQLGLLNILRGDYSAAEKNLKKAAAEFKNLSYLPGLALNAELFSYLEAQRKNDGRCRKYAARAEKLYLKIGNETAYLESLYLQAEALYRQQKDDKAEKILRRIIEYARGHATAFHIANAYSLLGLEFMRRGEFSRAKGLFQQSLEQEQKNDRWIGQACDYANIGLLELRCGKREQAQTHLQAALDLARAVGDNELSEKISENLER